MIIKILNNTTPYGKIMASHEGSLHSSTLNNCTFNSDMIHNSSPPTHINNSHIKVTGLLISPHAG